MMTARRTVDQLLADARARLDRLEPADAQAAVEGGALLIDTRSGELRRETGVIPGAVQVPLSVLFWRLDPSSGHDDPALSDPTRQVILVCAHGYSSSLAAATLRDLGFDRATDVIGGFEAWQAAGLPVIPPETDPREVLVVGARALAHADGPEAGVQVLLAAIAERYRIGSLAVFASVSAMDGEANRATGGLDLVATFGLGDAAAAGLAAAVSDPGHPIARTVADPVQSFDVQPTAPGGPALRSHLPLIVRRDGRETVVGVLALAHQDPTEVETRRILAACADLAAVAVESARDRY